MIINSLFLLIVMNLNRANELWCNWCKLPFSIARGSHQKLGTNFEKSIGPKIVNYENYGMLAGFTANWSFFKDQARGGRKTSCEPPKIAKFFKYAKIIVLAVYFCQVSSNFVWNALYKCWKTPKRRNYFFLENFRNGYGS